MCWSTGCGRAASPANAGAWDEWLKEIAPSTELRKWFGHDPDRWPEFRRRYRAELEEARNREALSHLQTLARKGPLTLLFAARDETHNNAVILRELLRETRKSG